MMLYPATVIRDGILHPNDDTRKRAVYYFSEIFSPDPTVMPVVIEAVEKYGRTSDTYRFISRAVGVAQTPDTVAWIIRELNSDFARTNSSHPYNLGRHLKKAEISALQAHEADLLNAHHFSTTFRETYRQRVAALAWDADTAWQKLVTFCDEYATKPDLSEVARGFLEAIEESLGRHGAAIEERLHDALKNVPDDVTNHRMYWMETSLLTIAGLARLESTVPLLVQQIIDDRGDINNEYAAGSLARIGTPAVLEAIRERFVESDFHFQLYTSGVLEKIHSERSVEICLELFRNPAIDDESIRHALIHAMLNQFPQNQLEVVRQYLLEGEIEGEACEIRDQLLAHCEITGERVPEFDEWNADRVQQVAKVRRRMDEMDRQMDQYDADRKRAEATAKLKSAGLLGAAPKPQSITSQTKAPAGRNDPCPCGSGKKYKKCCLKN